MCITDELAAQRHGLEALGVAPTIFDVDEAVHRGHVAPHPV